MPNRAPDLQGLVALVDTRPGITKARAAGALGGRRATALALIERGLAEQVVRLDVAYARLRGDALRTVQGLYVGPGDEVLVSEPGMPPGELRRLRERAGVSAARLAAAMGVSRRQLQRWESGEQVMPAAKARQLRDGLERAQQAAQAPRRPRPARRPDDRVYALVARVRARPGRTPWQLVQSSPVGRDALKQAEDAGLLHERREYVSRHPVWHVYPGPAPAATPSQRVLVDELRAARLTAGLSQYDLARHIGVTRSTYARWEQDAGRASGLEVPGHAAAEAARTLEWARQRSTRYVDALDEIAAQVEVAPGLWPRELAAALGYSTNPTFRRRLRELLDAGRLHEQWTGERGRRHGRLYPGPASAELLTREQLHDRRIGAGMTQPQLAELAGYTRHQVIGWENGRRIPLWAQARLAEVLDAAPVLVEVLDVPVRSAATVRSAAAAPPDVVDAAVLEALGGGAQTFRRLELLHVCSRDKLRASLERLVASDKAHLGRDGRGRGAYLLGPAASGATPGRPVAAGQVSDDELEQQLRGYAAAHPAASWTELVASGPGDTWRRSRAAHRLYDAGELGDWRPPTPLNDDELDQVVLDHVRAHPLTTTKHLAGTLRGASAQRTIAAVHRLRAAGRLELRPRPGSRRPNTPDGLVCVDGC